MEALKPAQWGLLCGPVTGVHCCSRSFSVTRGIAGRAGGLVLHMAKRVQLGRVSMGVP